MYIKHIFITVNLIVPFKEAMLQYKADVDLAQNRIEFFLALTNKQGDRILLHAFFPFFFFLFGVFFGFFWFFFLKYHTTLQFVTKTPKQFRESI